MTTKLVDFNRLNGPQRKVLRESLASAFDRPELDMFLDERGFEPLENVVAPGPFAQQVFELIADLTRKGRLANLVEAVMAERGDSPAIQDLEPRLLLVGAAADNQRVIKAATGRKFDLERLVRQTGFADLFLWTGKMLVAGRRMCRISYPFAGEVGGGTGFLVGPDLVLTNYHVIEPLLQHQAPPESVRVQFGYAETEQGLAIGEKLPLEPDWMVAQSPYSAADLAPDNGLPAATELDFAVLRVNTSSVTAETAATRGWVDLGSLPSLPQPGAFVFVLQHPKGMPLQHSMGVVQQPLTPLRLRYDADTEHGSSGALVLDEKLLPVALHHAGDPDSKIKARYNQGIPLHLIHAALAGRPEIATYWSGGGPAREDGV